MMPQRSFIALAAPLFIAACTSSAPSTDTEPASAPPTFAPAEGTTGTEAAAADEAAEAEAPTANHSITTSVEHGDDGAITLVTEATAANGYHLNTDPNFPWRVKVADDAAVAAGTSLRGADATTLEEEFVRFEIPVAAAGETTEIAGDMVLGVCDASGCIRVQEEIAWAVTTP